MSAITTLVLDISCGLPAAGIHITLERAAAPSWQPLGSGRTDSDGRLKTLLPANQRLEPGVYRLRFDTGSYFSAQGVDAFYPSVTVEFHVGAAGEHYHVPLLLSPFGYSTYRGS